MEEIDLKNIFKIFWSKKISIILIIATFITIGILYTTKYKTPQYSSSLTLVLSTAENEKTKNNSITTTDITLNTKLISTYSELIKSKTVLRQVINNLGTDINEEELRNNIKVSNVENTSLIKITVTTKNANDSANIANDIAKVFKEKVEEIYNINNVHIVDEAKVNNVPSNINRKKDILLFAMIGFVVSIVYVLILNILDTTIKTSEEVEKAFKIPVLAEIPLYTFDSKKEEKGGKQK